MHGCEPSRVYLKTTGEGPQNLCRVFLMLSLRVDSSKYQVLWSDAEGPAVGSTETYTETVFSPSSLTEYYEKTILLLLLQYLELHTQC